MCTGTRDLVQSFFALSKSVLDGVMCVFLLNLDFSHRTVITKRGTLKDSRPQTLISIFPASEQGCLGA